ncbi:MAG: hypothetical protein ACK50K_16810 [Betaproteobacteria bacterium]|jgi:hypothetical protein|nr:hypothetical protein [Rubrivivax sp.]
MTTFNDRFRQHRLSGDVLWQAAQYLAAAQSPVTIGELLATWGELQAALTDDDFEGLMRHAAKGGDGAWAYFSLLEVAVRMERVKTAAKAFGATVKFDCDLRGLLTKGAPPPTIRGTVFVSEEARRVHEQLRAEQQGDGP